MNESTALLVVDVQTEYMMPEPFVTSDGDDLVAKCRELIDRARAAGVPVVYVRHLDENPPIDPTTAEICREIAPRATEAVVEKRFPSAFFRTNLEQTLENLGARTLYACGLATFECLNATVMCALCKGYEVVVVRNAHGARAMSAATVEQVIAHFETAWENAGAVLRSARDIDFAP